MYFDSFTKQYTSILSTLDQWMFNNFEISTSLADSGQQVAVSLFALIIISFLIFFLSNGPSHKNKTEIVDAKEILNPLTNSSFDEARSLAYANSSLENITDGSKDAGDVDNEIETNDETKASDEPNIYELDNGFMINKRSADAQEALKADENSDDKNEKKEKDSAEAKATSQSSGAATGKKLNLSVELAKIETEMLDVRKEYKSGNISSMDYLAKTQELYNKGEVLVETGKSLQK